MLYLTIHMIEDTDEIDNIAHQRDVERSQTRPHPIMVEMVKRVVLGRGDEEDMTIHHRKDVSAAVFVPKKATTHYADLTTFYAHHRGVSRKHAMLKQVEGVLMVEDLNSTNGTYINEKRLNPHMQYPLGTSDVLRLGFLSLTLTLQGADVTDTTDNEEEGESS